MHACLRHLQGMHAYCRAHMQATTTTCPASWEALACSESARQALRAAGLGLAAAVVIVDKLGVEDASDLASIKEAHIQDLGLRPLEIGKLQDAVTAARNGSGQQASSGRSGSSGAELNSSTAKPMGAAIVSEHAKTAPARKTADAASTSSSLPMPSSSSTQDSDRKLMVVLQKGLGLGVALLHEVGPMLPFPGECQRLWHAFKSMMCMSGWAVPA